MANRDWEITEIQLGTRSRFHISGSNHCDPDHPGALFHWSVESVTDPRYFAGPQLIISEKVQAVLNVVGRIGSGV